MLTNVHFNSEIVSFCGAVERAPTSWLLLQQEKEGCRHGPGATIIEESPSVSTGQLGVSPHDTGKY